LTLVDEYINTFILKDFVDIHFNNDYSLKFRKFKEILDNAINENPEYVSKSILVFLKIIILI